jgi:hypothetical protein
MMGCTLLFTYNMYMILDWGMLVLLELDCR